MPDVQTSALLFAAGYTAWIISTFAGAFGSIVLVAFLTYVVRVKTIAPVGPGWHRSYRAVRFAMVMTNSRWRTS
jgi:hypothetical protein